MKENINTSIIIKLFQLQIWGTNLSNYFSAVNEILFLVMINYDFNKVPQI